MTLSESIIQVLSEAQSSLHHHQRLLKTLKALQDKHELVEFFQAFFQPFSNVLVIYKREPVAERVIDFVAKYAASVAPKDDSDDSDSQKEDDQSGTEHVHFLTLLLARLLSLHEARDKAVRFRVCQLVGRLLSCASDCHCSVPSELLESTQKVMLDRAYDKVPIVRVNAVSALELLQDRENPQCPVVRTLLELLRGDSSPDVRRSALSRIMVSNSTLQAIIERTRDVKDVIRREAFLRLSENCSICHLSIHQRIQLLSDGLNDRSGLVQEACVSGLLRSWSLSLDGDFLSLLSRLDVESSPEVAELALEKLFDNFTPRELVSSLVEVMAGCSQGENWEEEIETPGKPAKDSNAAPSPAALCPRVIPLELLRCEEAFYWSCLCRYVHKKGVKGEESLEQIVPTLSEFCDYIQSYVVGVLLVQEGVEEKMQAQFVARQLFSIVSVLDLSDEVGRRRLGQLVCDLLVMPGFPAALTEPLLAEQTKVWPQQAFRIEKLTEVIADIRQPPSLDLTSQASGDQSQLLGGPSCLVESNEHPETLLRSLAIACELAKELSGGRKLSPALQMLVQTLLFPCIQNENPYVRDMALNCLGLVCLLDIATARNHLLLFLQVSQVDHESVQATALKVIFDLLHVFGFEAFNAGEEEGGRDTGQSGGENQDSPGGDGSREGESPAGEEEPSSNRETEEPGSPSAANEPGSCTSSEEVQEERTATDHTTQRILNIMAEFLEGESPLLRVVAAEGLAKLLQSGRVLSPKLVAKLLVLWYNPTMQDEDRLRAALGAFFPAFATSDRSCRECLGEVYIPVMRMLFEAPPTSPLASINAGNMADFLIHLTIPTLPSEDSVHDSLAHAVSSAVLSDPSDSTAVRVYCRSLNQMQLTASNKSNAAELSVLLEQMLQEVKDRTSLQYLKKFAGILKTINPSCCAKEWMTSESDSHPLTPLTDGNKTQQSTTHTKVKNTAKKVTAAHSTRKKNEVTFQAASSESSNEENVDPDHPAERTMTSRLSKSVAVNRMAASTAAVHDSGVEEQSDDSLELVGEHSPFVKHTGNRRMRNTEPLKVLQFSDED